MSKDKKNGQKKSSARSFYNENDSQCLTPLTDSMIGMFADHTMLPPLISGGEHPTRDMHAFINREALAPEVCKTSSSVHETGITVQIMGDYVVPTGGDEQSQSTEIMLQGYTGTVIDDHSSIFAVEGSTSNLQLSTLPDQRISDTHLFQVRDGVGSRRLHVIAILDFADHTMKQLPDVVFQDRQMLFPYTDLSNDMYDTLIGQSILILNRPYHIVEFAGRGGFSRGFLALGEDGHKLFLKFIDIDGFGKYSQQQDGESAFRQDGVRQFTFSEISHMIALKDVPGIPTVRAISAFRKDGARITRKHFEGGESSFFMNLAYYNEGSERRRVLHGYELPSGFIVAMDYVDGGVDLIGVTDGLRDSAISNVGILQDEDRFDEIVYGQDPSDEVARETYYFMLRARSFPATLNLLERTSHILMRIHAEGFEHGDLTPHNILAVPDSGDTYIVDLGLSKRLTVFAPIEEICAYATERILIHVERFCRQQDFTSEQAESVLKELRTIFAEDLLSHHDIPLMIAHILHGCSDNRARLDFMWSLYDEPSVIAYGYYCSGEYYKAQLSLSNALEYAFRGRIAGTDRYCYPLPLMTLSNAFIRQKLYVYHVIAFLRNAISEGIGTYVRISDMLDPRDLAILLDYYQTGLATSVFDLSPDLFDRVECIQRIVLGIRLGHSIDDLYENFAVRPSELVVLLRRFLQYRNEIDLIEKKAYFGKKEADVYSFTLTFIDVIGNMILDTDGQIKSFIFPLYSILEHWNIFLVQLYMGITRLDGSTLFSEVIRHVLTVERQGIYQNIEEHSPVKQYSVQDVYQSLSDSYQSLSRQDWVWYGWQIQRISQMLNDFYADVLEVSHSTLAYEAKIRAYYRLLNKLVQRVKDEVRITIIV